MRIDEVSMEPQLPPEVTQAFDQLGELQRGVPEQAMVKAQQVIGGGLLSYALEHTGDITHRMSRQGGLMSWGQSEAATKIDRMYAMLNHGYGFEREVREQLAANAQFAGLTEGAYERRIAPALRLYSEAHNALPVYNAAQDLAKRAAVYLGQRVFDAATSCLGDLRNYCRDPQKWTAKCLEYRLDNNGQLLQYPYPRQYLRNNQSGVQ